jgi:hypothetical protein
MHQEEIAGVIAAVMVGGSGGIVLEEVPQVERFAKLPKQEQAAIPCQVGDLEEKSGVFSALRACSNVLPLW